MAEGSLHLEISNLQNALAGIAGLLGTPGEGGSGLAGGASLTVDASIGPNGFELDVDAQFSAVFNFDPQTAITLLQAAFDQIAGELELAPLAGIAVFSDRLEQVNGAFSGDLFGKIITIVTAVRGIASGIPENRMGVLAPLVEQLLAVLQSLRGPEAEQIQGWIESLEIQLSAFLPLIEAAANHPNPGELVIKAAGDALAGVLDVFEFPRIQAALGFLDGAPGNLMPQALLDELDLAFQGSFDSFAPIIPLVANPPALNAAIAVHLDAVQELRVKLRPVVAAVQAITNIDILQPGTLEARLRRLLDQALGVEIQDNQKIDDPFKALFDRIDAEVDKIDLAFVRDEVLGFFEQMRATLESLDIGAVGDQIQGQLDGVDGAVAGLQQGVTDLIQKVAEHFDGLVDKLKGIFGNLGTFEADNSFRFHLEKDLRGALSSAKLAVAGDPNDPDAPSIAGTLNDFQATVDAFLGKLSPMLQPLENASTTAVDDAVQGIQNFANFLNGLNIPTLMGELAGKVDAILDQLAPVEFGAITDPIVAELEDNATKIKQIDTDSLNDLVKMALNAALGAIMDIDFTVTIATPLLDEFAEIKAVPAGAIAVLQAQYEKALALLDEISPEQLLAALLAAFDVIMDAVGSLDITALLAPLDQVHDKHLLQPLAALLPSQLLAPVAQGYQGITGSFDDIDGAALMAPLTGKLDELKATITGLDITAPLDELLALVDQIKQALAEVRPSELLEGFSAAFIELEAELDRFKPSVIFAPVAQLADPLLAFLEDIQQDTITTLFDLFKQPLQALDRLNPEALLAEIRGKIDAVLALLRTVDPSVKYNQLKAQYFDLKGAVSVGSNQASLELSLLVDPQLQIGDIMAAYQDVVGALETAKQNLAMPDMNALYDEVRQRLLDLLPPYARALLDPETFKRLMRQASPLRFLEELDARFEAIKNKLIPIRPQDLGAELDATYETVIALVSQLDISEPVGRIVAAVNDAKNIVDGIRIDFVAEDIDQALTAFKAVLAGLDPARFFTDLDAIHAELVAVVNQTKPSTILAGLQAPLDQVQTIITNLDPRNKLEQPLLEAWGAILAALNQVDFTVILAPLVGKLDELELEFVAGLQEVEDAFDAMLAAGQSVLGDGALSVSVDISAGVSF